MNAEVDMRVDHKIGGFFLQHLKGAQKRLWIVSPWISADFIDLAVSKKLSGVDVKVLTSNDYVPGQKEAIDKLIESRTRVIKPENKSLKYVGVGIAILGLILVVYTKGYWIFLSFFGVGLYLLGREQTETYWISKLGEGNLKIFEYHPYRTLHAKVYVADDLVIMGSANFTRNGLEKNIEGVVVMKSEELASRTVEMLGRIQTTLNLKEIPYDAVGRGVRATGYQPHRYFRRYRR